MAKSILDRYEEAHAAFMRGSVHGESDDQLLEYLSGLANQNNTNTGTQHRDIIRGLTINNVLLKRHLDKLQAHIGLLNTQNTRTQYLVIALTVASLIGTGVQVWYAYRADVKSEPVSSKIGETPKLQGNPLNGLATNPGSQLIAPPVPKSSAAAK